MSEKILVIGSGFLGNSICFVANDLGIKSVGTCHSIKGLWIDIRDIISIEKVVSDHNPDFIINSAALIQIDEIESNPKSAYEVNAHGAKNVALIAQKKKIKLIHISTDSVFDGRKGLYNEQEETNPVNEYAKSKKMGEDFVSDVSDKFVIVRTNFYGYNQEGKFLFNWILRNLQNNKRFTAFTDVIFNPLEIRNLSRMIIELLHTDFIGVLHLSSDEILSKYEFAMTIAETMGFDSELIKKGSIKEAQFIARRPLDTSLSNFKAKKLLKTKPLAFEEWLSNQKSTF